MCFKWRALFESKPCLRKWFNTCSQLASSTMVRTSLLQVVRQQWGSSHSTEACNESCWRQQCACILQVITRLCENITDNYPKVTKEWKGHAGMEPSKSNKLDPKHFHTIPTSCAILPPLTQICFVFVSCVQRKVVEGSVVGSGGCVVHFDVHREWVMLWVAAM